MKEWIVTQAGSGKRLDMVLADHAGRSRKQIKRWLDSGVVRVNGRQVAIAKWKVKAGDRITVDDEPVSEATRERASARRPVRPLYEDATLIAVEKPPGMLVIPEAGTREPTVVDTVRAYLRRTHPTARGTYVRALHRLDRGTSGVVLLAKTKGGEAVIQQFKRREIGREYWAIVHGAVARQRGTITAPLLKGLFGHGKKAAVANTGRAAITHYFVEERYQQATLLTVRVETGRTHQIRVHLASIGHPLLGDTVYGRGFVSPVKLPRDRVALHAASLSLRHPMSGERLEIRSPLSRDLEQLVDRLRVG
ncbi:MAG: RluA family pseudouridine synthase [Deltaproteobacteria bacterium]|nr:RluA family pseudouridine synthase [Deltaproteobacteria bacterium]